MMTRKDTAGGRLSLLLLASLLAGCTTNTKVAIQAEHDPAYDFARLRTWVWAPGRPQQIAPERGDAFLRSRLDSIPGLIERELTTRGFRTAGAGTADFLVAYLVESREGRVDSFLDLGTYRLGGGSQDFSEAWTYGYEEGVLTIRIADARTRRLIWEGSGRAPIDEKLSQEERFARLARAVGEILARFPPAPGS
jgi:hypothetical protein